jgi:hypothetical protein
VPVASCRVAGPGTGHPTRSVPPAARPGARPGSCQAESWRRNVTHRDRPAGQRPAGRARSLAGWHRGCVARGPVTRADPRRLGVARAAGRVTSLSRGPSHGPSRHATDDASNPPAGRRRATPGPTSAVAALARRRLTASVPVNHGTPVPTTPKQNAPGLRRPLFKPELTRRR